MGTENARFASVELFVFVGGSSSVGWHVRDPKNGCVQTFAVHV